MTYYKATRPDGKSFHDGTTTWTVGKITRLPKSEQRTTLCEAGVLHASTEPGESLVGGSWPCRLFEVEPVGELITEAEHPYKVGAHAWRVVREIEAWRALGPNGEAVAALIERARTITVEQAERLRAAWGAAWGAAWDAARNAALALVVRDLISQKQFQVLYGPWASVMEGEG